MEGFTFDLGDTENAADSITIKITGIPDDAAEDAITDKLLEMMDVGSMDWTTVDDVLTVEITPVKDVEAFARKIDFGKVTEVKDKTITVQVAK